MDVIEEIAWGETDSALEMLQNGGRNNKQVLEALAEMLRLDYEEKDRFRLDALFGSLGFYPYYAPYLYLVGTTVHLLLPSDKQDSLGKQACTEQDITSVQSSACAPRDAWQNPSRYGYKVCRKCQVAQGAYNGEELHPRADHTFLGWLNEGLHEAWIQAVEDAFVNQVKANQKAGKADLLEDLDSAWESALVFYGSEMVKAFGQDAWTEWRKSPDGKNKWADLAKKLNTTENKFNPLDHLPKAWPEAATRWAWGEIKKGEHNHTTLMREDGAGVRVEPYFIQSLREDVLGATVRDLHSQKVRGYNYTDSAILKSLNP